MEDSSATAPGYSEATTHEVSTPHRELSEAEWLRKVDQNRSPKRYTGEPPTVYDELTS